ncbi:hypothetical protein EMIT0P43_20051 [Pseudomonas jessenii]
MPDGFDVIPGFFNVPAYALEVCFQLGDARFHINFSRGFCAIAAFSSMACIFVICERQDQDGR